MSKNLNILEFEMIDVSLMVLDGMECWLNKISENWNILNVI